MLTAKIVIIAAICGKMQKIAILATRIWAYRDGRKKFTSLL